MTAAGAYVISDCINFRIRLVDTSGIISTIAGNGFGAGYGGYAGYGGDGGQATSALLNNPVGIAVTPNGAIVFADSSNHRIRLISTAGIILTIAGNGVPAYGGDGGHATSASLQTPTGVAVSSTGAFIIADNGNHRIRQISAQGVISTIAGNGNGAFSGDGGRATSANLNAPFGVVLTGVSVIVSDSGNNRIRLIESGVISTIAGNGASGGGDGGQATSAGLSSPTGIAITLNGSLFVAESARIRLITTYLISPSASRTPSPTPYCMPSLFRSLPRMDLVGTLVGSALSPGTPMPLPSLGDCRQACCDAPACDGFSFGTGDASFINGGTAGCFLLVNITQLIPNNAFSSGIYESTL